MIAAVPQPVPCGAMVLSVIRPDGYVQEHRFSTVAVVTVGRDAECDVVLQAAEVSRCHATLHVVGAEVHITDSSSNGTYCNDARLCGESRTIAPGCVVRVGAYQLRVALEGPVPTEATAPSPQAVAVHGVADAASAPVPAPVAAPRAVPMPVPLRRRIHRMLLENLDLANLDRSEMDAEGLRPDVIQALWRILTELGAEVPFGTDRDRFVAEMTDEVLGLGPLERLLADPSVSEIMVVDPATIFCERDGTIEHTDLRFTDDESARSVIERIITPLGRRIDESNPYVDARLPDGSRVNAIIPPLALRGPCITIRRFCNDSLTLDDLVRFGSVTEQMARFLTRSVVTRRNILISGGTGSGKTTLLNILSGAISDRERIVTIEDAAELQMRQRHVVSLESRPENMEGRGAVTIRDLVRNALRMRPDRIVVGECRGGEALDMLQAMNTGHDGSMTTLHANNPVEALSRLETLALMAGIDLPARAIREQIASSVHLVVQQTRLSDGTRRVTSIAEVVGLADDGYLDVREIFGYARSGTSASGGVEGAHRATGYLPTFLPEFIKYGLVTDGEYL